MRGIQTHSSNVICFTSRNKRPTRLRIVSDLTFLMQLTSCVTAITVNLVCLC
jgi:hypothetical protein